MPKTVLTLYSHNQSAHLHGLKKIIQRCIGPQGKTEWAFTFAAGRGLDKAKFKELCARFDYVILVDDSLSQAFVLPEGVTHNAAAGAMYGNVLIVHEPYLIYATPEGAFLTERYLDKIFKPQKWIKFPEFSWQRLDQRESFDAFLRRAQSALLCAVDIETSKHERSITCVSFSCLLPSGHIITGVLDQKDDDFFQRLRALLVTSVPKIFQNGLYDALYLLRWNSPPRNWIWDTAYAFHAWYSELSKDLGFLSAFFIREFEYWKTEGRKAANLEEYHRYNAKDTYATLCIAIAQMREMPTWAKDNFYINFPRVFPALLMNAQGLRVDEARRKVQYDAASVRLIEAEAALQRMTGIPDFNARSHVQVKLVLKAFGITSDSDEKSLLKAAARHPILARVIEKILEVRDASKACNQYFDPELLAGRLYFNLHPAGTETGRLACQKSSFWCGAQIQNYPMYAKVYVQAEPGYVIVEIDNEQSETRCTAYMSQDTNLIATVESGKDFHSMNATVFFGVEYEVAKTKDSATGDDSVYRKLAKRINHAVSYNMGDVMFVEQAGAKIMELARKLLQLPPFWTHKQIASHLIAVFDKAYPRVRNDFQAEIKRAIAFTKRLVSPEIARAHNRPLHWTRWFFSDPNLSKPALNAAVAHGPQNLSVQIVNEGMLRVYQEVCFLPDRPVIMSAQIHDSLLFQIREDVVSEWLPKLHALMRKEVKVHGRILVIPTSHKITGSHWGKLRGGN